MGMRVGSVRGVEGGSGKVVIMIGAVRVGGGKMKQLHACGEDGSSGLRVEEEMAGAACVTYG